MIQRSRTEIKPWLFSQSLVIPVWVASVRYSYRLRDLVEQFDARPAEIKALFSNQPDPGRAADLRDRMLAAGLPI